MSTLLHILVRSFCRWARLMMPLTLRLESHLTSCVSHLHWHLASIPRAQNSRHPWRDGGFLCLGQRWPKRKHLGPRTPRYRRIPAVAVPGNSWHEQKESWNDNMRARMQCNAEQVKRVLCTRLVNRVPSSIEPENIASRLQTEGSVEHSMARYETNAHLAADCLALLRRARNFIYNVEHLKRKYLLDPLFRKMTPSRQRYVGFPCRLSQFQLPTCVSLPMHLGSLHNTAYVSLDQSDFGSKWRKRKVFLMDWIAVASTTSHPLLRVSPPLIRRAGFRRI